MKIFYSRKAEKQFKDLTKIVQKRIAKKMIFYSEQKNPLIFAKKLTDSREGEYRFCVGSYRVIFDVVDNSICVLKVDLRDKVYE